MNDQTNLGLPPPFLVLALARSRTAWLSQFLTYGQWICGHDELKHCRTLKDVTSWFMQPYIGSAEMMAATWWRLIPDLVPGVRILVVRRPVLEVVDSILELGVAIEERPKLLKGLKALDAKLDQVEKRLPRVLSVKYDDLVKPEVCKQVFEHCLLMPFDGNWWQHWADVKVEVNFHAEMRYWFAYMVQMHRLGLEAKHRILADLTARDDDIRDGLVIEEESFESAFQDGQELAEEHCIAIGEPPDEWSRDNIDVYRTMDKMGLLQVLTARANGKMFGYLMTIVGNGFTPQTVDRSATHTLFFASKDWPGAGLRLQREALARLKARGVEDVYLRSGMGVAARVETLYKRLGAEPEGKLFKIKLGG